MGDLSMPTIQEAAVRDTTELYNLAGEIRDVKRMHTINVEMVRTLLNTATRRGVARIVHLSSVGVIGAERLTLVTEETPCKPKNEYERTKYLGEQLATAAARPSGPIVQVVRPTNVFGEGSDPAYDSFVRLLQAVQGGRFFFVGRGAISNYVYVGDVVEAMVRLGQTERTRSGTWIVADPAPMTAFIEAMATSLGVATPRRTVPALPLWLVGAALEGASRAIHTPKPLTRQRVRALSSKQAFSSAKLRSSGVDLTYGFKEGLDRTISWYRAAGRL